MRRSWAGEKSDLFNSLLLLQPWRCGSASRVGLFRVPTLRHGIHDIPALHAAPTPDLERAAVEQEFRQLLRNQQAPAAAAPIVVVPLLFCGLMPHACAST